MTDARMVATNTHRRWRAVQSAAPRADRMTCSSHGLALGLIKTRCLPVQSLHLTILLERSVQLAMVPRSHTGERRQISQCLDALFRAPQVRGAVPQPVFLPSDAGNPGAGALFLFDGYAGFERLTACGDIVLAVCVHPRHSSLLPTVPTPGHPWPRSPPTVFNQFAADRL